MRHDILATREAKTSIRADAAQRPTVPTKRMPDPTSPIGPKCRISATRGPTKPEEEAMPRETVTETARADTMKSEKPAGMRK
tara:strand:+ start:1493 stop:1738 length:246 start_codon:yes stop_codon:yes gene_type:complete